MKPNAAWLGSAKTKTPTAAGGAACGGKEEYRVLSTQYLVLKTEVRVQNVECKVQSMECLVLPPAPSPKPPAPFPPSPPPSKKPPSPSKLSLPRLASRNFSRQSKKA